jgi:hypothetical protein
VAAVTTPRRRRPSPVTVALTAIGGIVVGIVLVGVVLNLASDPDVDVNLGSDVFEAGKATRMAEQVAEGGPLLFQALRGDRDIYVQHLGPKARQGWRAFDAKAPDAPRRCQLRWQQDTKVFVDPCDDATYPRDGEGLVQYATTVDNEGTVVVDLRKQVE